LASVETFALAGVTGCVISWLSDSPGSLYRILTKAYSSESSGELSAVLGTAVEN
jgi:hypothetical protein